MELDKRIIEGKNRLDCFDAENEELMKGVDSVLGDGASRYIGEAIEAFYMRR